jgi:hypothetical protein
MPSQMLSRTENFRETNRRLVFFLDALPAKPGLQAVASPEHMAALLAELLRAGTELRAEPLPAKGSDPELDKALYEYRSHVERLRQLLPSIHRLLLGERARLEAQRTRVRSAAEWARASRQTL